MFFLTLNLYTMFYLTLNPKLGLNPLYFSSEKKAGLSSAPPEATGDRGEVAASGRPQGAEELGI